MAEQNTSANSSQPTSHLSTTALELLHSSLSEAAKRGLLQIEIKKLGRWTSDAVQKYVRNNYLLC